MAPHNRALLGYRVKCTDGICRFVHAQDAENAIPVYGDPDYDPRPVFRRQIERMKRQGFDPRSGRRRRSNKLPEPAQQLDLVHSRRDPGPFSCHVNKLALEAVAVRQLLGVLKRKQPRPKLDRLDRLFWVVLRLWGGWSEAPIIVKPETVVSWHRAGFQRLWLWRSQRRLQTQRK